MKDDKFVTFINGCSVGWHLARAADVYKSMFTQDDEWDHFVKWVFRHFEEE